MGEGWCPTSGEDCGNRMPEHNFSHPYSCALTSLEGLDNYKLGEANRLIIRSAQTPVASVNRNVTKQTSPHAKNTCTTCTLTKQTMIRTLAHTRTRTNEHMNTSTILHDIRVRCINPTILFCAHTHIELKPPTKQLASAARMQNMTGHGASTRDRSHHRGHGLELAPRPTQAR
jgi:hypothetical protein